MAFTEITKLTLKQIKENFANEAQSILQNYLYPFDGSPKADLYALPVERVSHGVQHVARVAIYIPLLITFCKSVLAVCPPEIESLTEEQVTLLQLAALHHDMARKNDKDEDGWEKESAERWLTYLKSKNIDDIEAINFYQYITRQKKDVLNLLLETADSLDIMRAKPSLQLEKVPLFVELYHHQARLQFVSLAVALRQLIAGQHDLRDNCEIKYRDQIVAQAISKTRDAQKPQLKQYYEQAKNSYSLIQAEVNKMDLSFKKESAIEQNEAKEESYFHEAECYSSYDSRFYLCCFPSKAQAEDAARWVQAKIESKQVIEVRLRSDIKTNAPWQFRLSEAEWSVLAYRIVLDTPKQYPQREFLVKSLRADSECFASSFFDTLFGKKMPLRRPKQRDKTGKRYTVTGAGIYRFSSKTPQYSASEKQGYSKAQSVSWASPDYWPPVFGHGQGGNQRSTLAGVLLSMETALITDRNFIYDSGTIYRPYDCVTEQEAKRYAKEKIGKILFAKNELDQFKKIASDPNNRKRYNEMLCRLKYDPDHDITVFIGNDNLESRLQAVEYARLLKAKLIKQGLVSQDFDVPIQFYTPNQLDLHFKPYTKIQHRLDELKAMALYYSIYNIDRFQLLLALPKQRIVSALLAKRSAHSLMHRIIMNGYIHLLASLSDKVNISISDLVTAAGEYHADTPLAWYHLRRAGYVEAAEVLLASQSKVDFTLEDSDGNNIILRAVLDNSDDVMDDLLKKIGGMKNVIVNTANCKSVVALQQAVANGNNRIVKQLLPFTNLSNVNIALHQAFQSGYLAIVLTLLERKGINVHFKSLGVAPIHRAIGREYLEAVKRLVDIDKSVLADKDDDGASPLHCASQGGHLPILEYLLIEQHVPIDVTRGKDGFTSLHVAVENDNLAVMTYLIKMGAKVNKVTSKGDTAFDLAIQHGRIDLVRYFLSTDQLSAAQKGKANYLLDECVDKVDEQVLASLLRAVHSEHLGVIRALARAEKVTNQMALQAFNLALEDDKLLVVEYFIKEHNPAISCDNFDKNKQTPLHIAAKYGYLRIATFLMERGANSQAKDSDGLTALMLAVSHDHVAVVKAMLRFATEYLDLRYHLACKVAPIAAEKGCMSVLHYFVSNEFRIEAKPWIENVEYTDKKTLLHIAAKHGQAGAVKYLSENASPFDMSKYCNKPDSHGITPIMEAALAGHAEIVTYLVGRNTGALTTTDNRGSSVMHYAVRSGNPSVVKAVIEAGRVRLDYANTQGETPLYLAAHHRYLVILNDLITKGASIEKAMISAAKQGDPDVIDYFLAIKNIKSVYRAQSLREHAVRVLAAKEDKAASESLIARLQDFIRLESWIVKSKSIFANMPADYQRLVDDIFNNTYAVFQENALPEAVGYFINQCQALDEQDAIKKYLISPSLIASLFFKSPYTLYLNLLDEMRPFAAKPVQEQQLLTS
jgi:ankyrin repeat protein